MTQKDFDKMENMMMKVVGDGLEAVVFPKFDKIDERFEKMEQSMKRMKEELIEMFKRGQKSLSNRLEEVEVDVREINKKIDKVVEKDKDYGKRLDKVERIVKAN